MSQDRFPGSGQEPGGSPCPEDDWDPDVSIDALEPTWICSRSGTAAAAKLTCKNRAAALTVTGR